MACCGGLPGGADGRGRAAPEYLCRDRERSRTKVKMVALAGAHLSVRAVLAFTGVGSVTDWGRRNDYNDGPHGFSEILYAFTSATANNGSAVCGTRREHGLLQQRAGFRRANPAS